MSVVVPLMCLYQLFLCSPFRCLSSHPRWLCAHLRSPLCLPPASSLSDHLSLSCWLPPCSPCCKNLPGLRARKGGNLYLEPEKQISVSWGQGTFTCMSLMSSVVCALLRGPVESGREDESQSCRFQHYPHVWVGGGAREDQRV